MALCIAQDGEWESRCTEHVEGRTVAVKRKESQRFKTKKLSQKNEVLLKTKRGKKRRVIDKGEFPGQHLDYD